MSRLSKCALNVDRVMLIMIFDVVKLAQLVVVTPVKSITEMATIPAAVVAGVGSSTGGTLGR